MATTPVGVAKVQTADKDINQLQSNFSQALQSVQQTFSKSVSTSASSQPLSGGQILIQQTLNAGDNTLPHALNKTLTGWLIVRQRASSQIYDKQDTNGAPESTLILNASAAVKVDIYVF